MVNLGKVWHQAVDAVRRGSEMLRCSGLGLETVSRRVVQKVEGLRVSIRIVEGS